MVEILFQTFSRYMISKSIIRVLREHKQTLVSYFNRLLICNRSISENPVYLNPVPPSMGDGGLNNYYHFIFDLLLPLNLVLNKTPQSLAFYMEEIGVNCERLKMLFGKRILIVTKNTIDDKVKPIPLIGMDPDSTIIKHNTLESFKMDIFSSMGIPVKQKNNKVILIERASFMTGEKYKIERGSLRRSIINHEDLKQLLESILDEAYLLLSLKLEELSFQQQLEYFNSAALVIAQHGAGLANCVWMKPGSAVVELSCYDSRYHYKILSRLKKHDYFFYKTNDEHVDLNLETFRKWITSKKGLNKFFKDNK